jgi:molybdopterin-guanine dinucleotide biosynthesis protein A
VTRISGIVLAGGRSTRFGADKLAALVDGRPLVHRPIEALAAIVDEVVIVVGPDGVPPLPAATRVPLRIVRDDEPSAGPLAGARTGLEEAAGDVAILAAGDMPGLVVALLSDLAARVGPSGVEAAVLCDGDQLRPVPSALARDAALAAATTLRGRGIARLRDLFGELRTDQVPEHEWRHLDPDAASLIDVDRPEDLPR